MTDIELIHAICGKASVARLVSVKPPAVSYWKRVGIPPLRRLQLQVLRPNLFRANKVI